MPNSDADAADVDLEDLCDFCDCGDTEEGGDIGLGVLGVIFPFLLFDVVVDMFPILVVEDE